MERRSVWIRQNRRRHRGVSYGRWNSRAGRCGQNHSDKRRAQLKQYGWLPGPTGPFGEEGGLQKVGRDSGVHRAQILGSISAQGEALGNVMAYSDGPVLMVHNLHDIAMMVDEGMWYSGP